LRRYPRIWHLAGSLTDPDDLQLSDCATAAILARRVDVYEKLDGLNVGLRFRRPGDLRVISRSFGELQPERLGPDLWPLGSWALRHLPRLWALLGRRYAAFGEWLAVQIGVHYRALPDLFVFFDLFDVERGRFVERATAWRRFSAHGFLTNQRRYRGRVTSVAQLARVCPESGYGGGTLEGWIVVSGARTCKFVQASHRSLPLARRGRLCNQTGATARHRCLPVPV
jgi:hypothetical protein